MVRQFLKSYINITFFFIASFILWGFAFHEFLFDKIRLVSDGVSYFNHIKFYIENLASGVYPLWDPNWNHGVPNEFFLRRLGSFNPFFLIILFFYKLGVPYSIAYLYFLSSYYFMGMIGFYKLAKVIFKNTTAAFAAYLLLMFSSLGTRLFDSYILFTFIPMVWFFYFFVAFSNHPKKHTFVGVTFTLMIMLTTYIPFYFVTIFISFILCFSGIYWNKLKEVFFHYLEFFTAHKLLATICALALILSSIPGLIFYKQAGTAETVFPMRHYNSSAKNEIEVDFGTITKWAMTEDIIYASAFSDLRKFKFAIVYIPGFIYLLLCIGFFAGITKRLILFFLWGLGLFIVCSPHAPIYDYLYKHIFYFKYFRNLHFFLWFALLPILILFAVEQFRLILNYEPNTRCKKYFIFGLIGLVHFSAAVFLLYQKDVVMSSYFVVGASLIFFTAYFAIPKFRNSQNMVLASLLLLIVLQPMEVYSYLIRNSLQFRRTSSYQYETVKLDFLFKTNIYGLVEGENDSRLLAEGHTFQLVNKTPNQLYYTTKWYDFLHKNLNGNRFREYLRYKFKIYDHFQEIGAANNQENINQIFTSSQPVQNISGNSDKFRVLRYTSNSIEIKTNFKSRKFLVYNDNFHSGWMTFLNNKKVNLVRANIAFKGIWVPPGENIIYFRFGAPWRYVLNYALMALFNIMLFWLLWNWYKENQERHAKLY